MIELEAEPEATFRFLARLYATGEFRLEKLTPWLRRHGRRR